MAKLRCLIVLRLARRTLAWLGWHSALSHLDDRRAQQISIIASHSTSPFKLTRRFQISLPISRAAHMPFVVHASSKHNPAQLAYRDACAYR
jgi:hypothetical protein